jgi:DNA/RNA endonuclease G (NUC1)
MDRFSIYLLGAMAALLITLGVFAYSRHHDVTDVPADTTVTTAVQATTATVTPTPVPLFGSSDTASLASSTPVIPMAPASSSLPGAALMSGLATAPAAPVMPTPVPWTPPNWGKVTTVIYPGFTVVYSTALGNPAAVQYAMVQGAKPKRYPEPVKVKTPDPRLFAAAGYSAGTMAFPESISMYFGKQSGAKTSLMPNLCAFDPATLGGPWTKLAELEIHYAQTYKWIEIVTGPIFSTPPMQSGGLVIPSAFYRVYRRSYGDCMAFIIPQGSASTKMESYLTSVSSVEAATGLPIFGNTLAQDARDQVQPAVW